MGRAEREGGSSVSTDDDGNSGAGWEHKREGHHSTERPREGGFPDTHTPELGTYSTLFHAEQPHDIVHTNLSKQGITNCFAAYLGITLREG